MNEDCLRGIWVDLIWINGLVLGVNFVDLFFKDVVNILVNGYVIICFMVDNFGIFMLNFFLCLIEINLIFILTLIII